MDPTHPDDEPCPACGEAIKASAKKCRFCGEFLDADLRAEVRGDERARPPTMLKLWGLLIAGLAGLGLVGMLLATLSGFMPRRVLAIGGVLIYAVLARIGFGLFQGRRWAVIGICFYLAFMALGLLGAWNGAVAEVAAAITAGALGVFLPPILLGFAYWERLR